MFTVEVITSMITDTQGLSCLSCLVWSLLSSSYFYNLSLSYQRGREGGRGRNVWHLVKSGRS